MQLAAQAGRCIQSRGMFGRSGRQRRTVILGAVAAAKQRQANYTSQVLQR
jgi:hypothetical protein